MAKRSSIHQNLNIPGVKNVTTNKLIIIPSIITKGNYKSMLVKTLERAEKICKPYLLKKISNTLNGYPRVISAVYYDKSGKQHIIMDNRKYFRDYYKALNKKQS